MPSLSTSLWLTPLILLPGVAMLVLSTSIRLNRLHDEVHDLLHGRHRVSRVALDHLRRRTGLFHRALVALYVCIGLFALASLLGMLGVAQGVGDRLGRVLVFGVTALGVGCLCYAALELVRESYLAKEIIDEHWERVSLGETAPSDDAAPLDH